MGRTINKIIVELRRLSCILYVIAILIQKLKVKSLIIKKSKVIQKLIFKPYFLFSLSLNISISLLINRLGKITYCYLTYIFYSFSLSIPSIDFRASSGGLPAASPTTYKV
jgi:hypothetical protein